MFKMTPSSPEEARRSTPSRVPFDYGTLLCGGGPTGDRTAAVHYPALKSVMPLVPLRRFRVQAIRGYPPKKGCVQVLTIYLFYIT